MPQIRAEVLRAAEEALEQYEEDVERSPLTRNTKDTYLLHARNFVRWMKGEFEPGATLRRRGRH